ncbi:DUF6011 domain-containing protein [Streptomyces sp. NRRL F-5135]|uniref:DUF6011 domain-containing protein n=1 Tax=Streptomyces sp. NRRL F-5135 TaxID=1463858 RepID=UPI0004C92FA2|nr:DUF6011 domain-containing protein [Streptomyces sp. NRRL F-5135]
MTAPRCEVCGRGLRTTASAARRIGPVCLRRTRPAATPGGLPAEPRDDQLDHAALTAAGQLTLEEDT